MVWSGFNYLLPVSALAYLAGMGVLASLVALTIRRWLTAFFFLVLGVLLYVWVIIPATCFPSESPFATFYVFSAYPHYVFIKPGEK